MFLYLLFFFLAPLTVFCQTTTSQCFDIYTPQLENAAEEWSNSYTDCINKAGSDRDIFLTQMQDDQTYILDNSNNITNYINSCQAIENDIDFFNCFAGLNQNILRSVYTISNKAMVDAALLNEQLNGIDVSMSLCTNATEFAYVEQVAAINDGLNDCLKFGFLETETSTSASDVLQTDAMKVNAVNVGRDF